MPQRLIVVKVGTSGITTSEGKLDQQEMENLPAKSPQQQSKATKSSW